MRLENIADFPTHAGQTAQMPMGVEAALMEHRPRIVLVGGDANTNLAAAIAARKLRLSLGHIEAGERSYDWRMPEEHNRVMIDHISDDLFVTNDRAVETLRREAVRGRIHVTGNPIVDASRQHAAIAAERSGVLSRLGAVRNDYGVMTMHREGNVDSPTRLKSALAGISRAAAETGFDIHFMAHPRTRKRLDAFGLADWSASLPRIRIWEPVGCLDFLHL